ncbi:MULTISPECIES: LysR family transcriptional regulator [Rhizobium]|uniref:LysR family transcriptional regulator n=1 Tax=Rhizobium wuzhouense TaxID=1986026 RepID=A0ABX5NKG0_9HYPH|nr:MULTISPECIES: LysR substrate-binding domain-containing protein [Rhizobium]PYB69854.1 LysR family transcriptional regulator [Rhizobium wuzhouense]RKE77444.1 transcriptional regulator [Rhizobium sp. AG855]
MLDLVHLRSFVSISQLGSFTAASQKLGLGQSTVSQHLQRLEAAIGRRLLDRDTHGVQLTADGEALLPHARQLLSLERQTSSLFEAARPSGRLRLGISEDLVSGQLPVLLQDFIADYPAVELHLTVALSKDLADMQDKGELDLVFAKRRLGDRRGEVILREPLVWLAADPDAILANPVLPLIVFPPPSLTRTLLMEALERTGHPWRIVCSCQSLSGLTAAARAGMGVLVQPRNLAPPGLRELPPSALPTIEDVEFILVAAPSADRNTIAAFTRLVRDRVTNGLTPSR